MIISSFKKNTKIHTRFFQNKKRTYFEKNNKNSSKILFYKLFYFDFSKFSLSFKFVLFYFQKNQNKN